MRMNPGKKRWSKPQLIVLSRGTPEESVLVRCKGNAKFTPGPNYCGNMCQELGGCGGTCESTGVS